MVPASRAPETIFAVASGSGRAALCVIRISGPQTRFALETMCGRLPDPRRATLVPVRDAETILDRAIILWFPGPNSFTGEDSAEFQLHGGRAVQRSVLDRLAKFEYCRLALPGEFARRALANGKMDLAETEGLADLIDAETEYQRRQAIRQMDGALSGLVHQWRSSLIRAMALIEAEIDFSDEYDANTAARAEIELLATSVRNEIEREVAASGKGHQLRDGLSVVIAGPPNAGKSTLLNALARRDVAIVSATAGTTRDLIEVRLDLAGYPLSLIDTAGLRETTDEVEREGISRALRAAETADLGLWLDGPDEDKDPPAGTEWIRVRTKADLCSKGGLQVSAKTGAGMAELLARLEDECSKRLGAGDATVSRLRQSQALSSAVRHLDQALTLCADGPAELVAEDLRLAVRSLDSVIGMVGVEDVLDALFSTFCIGK